MDRQTSSAISFARSPRSRFNRAGDLEWIMESLYFSSELGEPDEAAPDAVESEPLTRLLQVQGDWERQISDVISDYLDASNPPESELLSKLAQYLESLGCYGSISVATHLPPVVDGKPASFSPIVATSFLVIRPPGVASPILVDPTFRDKFTVARPSPEYKALLEESVPVVAVGSLTKIRVIVSLLSERMARSFHAMGLLLPPWRRLVAMLSLYPTAIPEEAPSAPAMKACAGALATPVARLPSVTLSQGTEAGGWQGKVLQPPNENTCSSGQLAVALGMASRAVRAG